MLASELSGLLAAELDFDLCYWLLHSRDRQPIAGLDPEEPGDSRNDRRP